MGELSEKIVCRTAACTGEGGIKLFYRVWSPAQAPMGALLVVHGAGEHSGRYDRVGRRFADLGLAVYALDLRGCGQSAGRRAHVDGIGQYVSDVHCLRQVIAQEQPDARVAVVGHSMGGLVALHYVAGRGDAAAALVLSSPLCGFALPLPRLKTALAPLLSACLPTLRIASAINPAHLSRDQRVGEAYARDPLVGRSVTPRWFCSITRAMDSLTNVTAAVTIPSLVLQAGDDRLVSVAAARAVYKALGSADKHLIVYPDCFHEIFNETEPQRERILGDLTAWLAARSFLHEYANQGAG